MRDCTDLKTKGREGKQDATKSDKSVPKDKAKFFSLESKGDKCDLLKSFPVCVSLIAYEKLSEFLMIMNCLVDFIFPYDEELMLVRHVWIIPKLGIRIPFGYVHLGIMHI